MTSRIKLFAIAATALLALATQLQAKELPACSIENGTTVPHGTVVGGQICDAGSMITIKEWAEQKLAEEEKKILSDDFISSLEEICASVTCQLVRP